MYILKNAFGIFLLWELGFRLTRLGSQEISHRFWGNPSPILGKSATDFEEICHRFWGNPSPILGKSVTGFGEICHRFWGKTCAFFGKNRLRFWEKTCSVFGKNRLRFWEEQAPFLGQTGSVFGKKRIDLQGKLVWFLDWLGTKLKSHCFERKACLGLDFEVLGRGL